MSVPVPKIDESQHPVQREINTDLRPEFHEIAPPGDGLAHLTGASLNSEPAAAKHSFQAAAAGLFSGET